MSATTPETVICRYRVRAGQESAFEALLARHWPTLSSAGLVTERAPRHYRGLATPKPGDRDDASRVYVEIFEWKDAEAPGIAHHSPAVMAIWEPMGTLCEEMDFPHFEPIHPLEAGE